MSSTEPRAAAVADARTAAAGGPPAAPTADAPARSARVDTVYRPRHPLDFWTTVGMIRRGRGDPAHLHDRGVFWRASRTPHGIATLATAPSGDGSINASAWGPGAEWAIAQLPALLGSLDDPTPFEAHHHPLIAATHRRNPGLRLTRTDLVFDALAASIIEQKVTGLQAFGAWRVLMTRFGTRAPGPAPRALFAPPSVAEPQTFSSLHMRTGAFFAISAMAMLYFSTSDSSEKPGIWSRETALYVLASSPYLPCRDSHANRRVSSQRRIGRGSQKGV